MSPQAEEITFLKLKKLTHHQLSAEAVFYCQEEEYDLLFKIARASPTRKSDPVSKKGMLKSPEKEEDWSTKIFFFSKTSRKDEKVVAEGIFFWHSKGEALRGEFTGTNIMEAVIGSKRRSISSPFLSRSDPKIR